jgi:putative ABC transport system permease protein
MADPVKVYRWLLKLYPARFREEYGGPLERAFADECRESGGARLWLRTLADLAVSVPRQAARELRQDIIYGLRVYARKPLTTVLAVAALALALGATTGVFSVINAAMFASLPFREPERIVKLQQFVQDAVGFGAWRARSLYLEDAAGYTVTEMNLNAQPGTFRAKVAETSANFFSILGSQLALGRIFASDEQVAGRDAVAVISYGLWQQSFGADPRAIGSTIRLNGVPLNVVGVASAGFDYPEGAAVWTPTVFDRVLLPKSGATAWTTIGRLKRGLTLAQAESIFEAEFAQAEPAWMKQVGTEPERLVPLRDHLVGPVRQASLVLMGAVLLILLMACVNIANLLLTRVTDRRRELVIRAALGASRARLVQQLITESVVLSVAGAAAGLVVAHWAARLATLAQPAKLVALDYTIVNAHVLAFATGLAVVCGIAFGVLPAWLMSRVQPAGEMLRALAGRGPGRLQQILIATQVSLTLVLLAGSVAMGRGFLRLMGADPGFRAARVVTMNVSLAGTRRTTESGSRQYYQEALARLRSVPGVISAGGIEYLPVVDRTFPADQFRLESGSETVFALAVATTPDYFRTMGTEVIYGREFTPTDQPGVETVAVVNEAFARRLGDPRAMVGRRITSILGKKSMTIVGVAKTIRYIGPDDFASIEQVFVAQPQGQPQFLTFVARVSGKPEAILASCRDAVRSVDPEVPVFGVQTLEDRLAETRARPRFYTTVVLFFGGFALLLAIIDLYSTASYTVVQRTHEIGVRIAVGASADKVRRQLLVQGLLPVMLGLTAGWAGATALGRFLEHLMSAAIQPNTWTCVAVSGILVMVASAAMWSATRRVLRLDPMEVLRAE